MILLSYLTLILYAFSIWVLWKMFSWLHDHVKLVKKIRDSGVPGMRCYPVVGILPILFRYILFGPKHIPTNAGILPIILGMANVFRKDGMCRVDIGWFRQIILVYSKEAAEAVLNDPKEQKKSTEYKFLSDFIGTGLSTAPFGKWRKHRRILSPAFSPRVIESFQTVMYDHSQHLIQNIKSELRNESMKIDDLIVKCSLGILTETAMGIKFGSGSEKTDAYVTAVREVLKVIGRRIVAPWLWPEVIFRLSPSGLKLRKYMKIVHSFVGEIIQKKKIVIREDALDSTTEIPSIKRRPFLELLLLHNVRCNESDRLTDDEILDETHTFTFAGSDSVSSSLNWTMHYLGRHPEVMEKAWEEINSILQGDKEREITLDDVKQMEYLEKVILETLRIRPAVPALLRVLRHDIKVGNVTLPKDATIGILLSELHTSPDVFVDGEKFNPDRFNDAKINSFQFMPFSAGPRNCLGQRFAVLEMKTVLSNLIRHLDWASLAQEDEVLPNPDIVTIPHKPIKFHFWERH